MENEIWRSVDGYEGLYEVSNFGRVRSLGKGKTHRKPHIMKQTNLKKYLKVGLCKDGKTRMYFVHGLVAKAFPEICGKWFEGAECNHKDENGLNNYAWNLEWCTKTFNVNYGTRNQRVAVKMKVKMLNRPDQSKPVEQYTKDGVYIATYPSIVEAYRQTGIKHQSIGCCCQRKKHYNTAGGFIWRYAE